MSRVYGNLMNRFEEGKNYTGREIQVGDDVTMYYYSDRTCYYVTKVTDQKHITVARYEVCADHDMECDMGHQNWVYFKTLKEQYDYLKAHGCKGMLLCDDKPTEEEWVFRYGKWRSVAHRMDGKLVYYELHGNISFGVRDYFYDWSY